MLSYVHVKRFVMSLPAISLEIGCVYRKGGTGEVGWYIHLEGKTAWLCLDLAVKILQ